MDIRNKVKSKSAETSEEEKQKIIDKAIFDAEKIIKLYPEVKHKKYIYKELNNYYYLKKDVKKMVYYIKRIIDEFPDKHPELVRSLKNRLEWLYFQQKNVEEWNYYVETNARHMEKHSMPLHLYEVYF